MATEIHDTLEEGYDFFIIDNWGEKHHFKISTFIVPSGLLSEAIEIIDSEKENVARTFHVLSSFESDIEKAEILLKAKIKKRINQKHLIFENEKFEIGEEQELRGKISWNDNFSDTEFDKTFIIDGKRITIEKFIELLQLYENWDFKFKIYDSTDEID